MLKDLLQNYSTEIAECGDGSEALRSAVDFDPQWVLIDLEMPGMHGLEAVREIKRQRPSTRVLVISQHDDPELHRAAAAAGASGYLAKDNLLEVRKYFRDSNLPPAP